MRTILLALIYAVLVVCLTILLLLFWPFGVREPLLGFGKWAMRLGFAVLGVKIAVTGREQIDKKAAYIFMANHLSFLDGPMLFMLIPQSIRVILKKEVFRLPVVGQGMRFVGFVPVDRKRIRGGKKSIDLAARLMREKRYSYLIFPEGTRSRDGRTQAFKRGGFFLAQESRAAVVPVSIRGTFELMPRGTVFTKRGEVKVAFHSPVSVLGYDQSNMQLLIDKVRGVIESGLKA
ncbi:MAG: lysophospholipid acyltransferase family protein [Acidobacteriota bacterium]